MLVIEVVGDPAPQGSKRAIPIKSKATGAFTGKVNMVESSKKVKPWRTDVRDAVLALKAAPIDGAVNVGITFFLKRPKAHYRTGKFAHLLRDDAPVYPDVKPDIDKLARATLDALTSAGIYADDCKVVDLHTRKRYADHRLPGASIQLITKTNDRNAPGRLA